MSNGNFNRGPAYGLSAEVKNKLAQKYDPQRERELRAWIEGATGRRIGDNFMDGLKDGVILCELINKLQPGSVQKVNDPVQNWHKLENIGNFLRAITRYGVKPHDIFEANDLFENTNHTLSFHLFSSPSPLQPALPTVVPSSMLLASLFFPIPLSLCLSLCPCFHFSLTLFVSPFHFSPFLTPFFFLTISIFISGLSSFSLSQSPFPTTSMSPPSPLPRETTPFYFFHPPRNRFLLCFPTGCVGIWRAAGRSRQGWLQTGTRRLREGARRH
ncbi:uncharacterized protein [Anser cygnoides]|uniref:uncharacterized protein isoform X2 n=1 Tax=Anser cygnoides TaxID=8845 RepID=UPI0034D362AD